jgi:protein-L-isoaspartate(D-aspartate) O-methyltransferase
MGDRELAENLASRGIRDPRVLQAIASLDRSHFVPTSLVNEAGGDYPLPIGYGQTISQPYVVAFMTEALELRGDERVLEIGTGSGYQTAVLAKLCAEVYSIEIVPELAASAERALGQLGLPNVFLRHGNGYAGWPEAAPFDAIILTAAPQEIPGSLMEQLRPGGRLIAPVGGVEDVQDLVRVRKGNDGEPHIERLLPVRFVPMTGSQGATQ